MVVNKIKSKDIATVIICLTVCFGIMACEDKDNGDEIDDKNGYFNTKTANFTFKKVDKGVETTEAAMWDDHGKLYRFDTESLSSIVDETTGKGYCLIHTNKTYFELSDDMISTLLESRAIHKFHDNPSASGYQKLPNRTIAGKECEVYSYAYGGLTYTIGGWNNLMFFMGIFGTMEENNLTIDETNTATSYSEFVPTNSFMVPSDYTLRE